MKTESSIRNRIATLLGDDRLHYRSATVFENAPLALIQIQMETEINVLSWILEEPPPKIKRAK